MAIDPAMFGLGGPGAGPGPMPPGMYDAALSAMDQVVPKAPHPTDAVAKQEKALQLAHDLLMAVIPQLMQQNPKLAKDAHAAARQIVAIRTDLRKEAAPGPPPDLSLGMGLGGSPGALGPAPALGQGAPGLAG